MALAILCAGTRLILIMVTSKQTFTLLCAAVYLLLPAGCCPAQQRAWRHPHPVQQEPPGQALPARHSTQPARPVRHSQPRVISRVSGSGLVQCNSGEFCWHGGHGPTHGVPAGTARGCAPGSNSGSNGSSSSGCGNTGDGWECAPIWASGYNAAVRATRSEVVSLGCAWCQPCAN
jgi:hypothetical protein